MANRIKRFVEIGINNNTCNLQCDYCYVSQHKLFDKKPEKLPKTPEFYAKALSKKRLGGACMLNLCAAGETLLQPQIIDIIKCFLEEGHYAMIVTNGTLTSKLEELADFPEKLKERLFLKISFHYRELKRLNLLETFSQNIKIVKNAKISFTLEITPTDELEPYIDEIKEFSMREFGALPHFTIARNELCKEMPILSKHTNHEYKNIWKIFNSELFDFKYRFWGKKRTEYCYAGEWSIVLDLSSGYIRQCYSGKPLGNIYEDLTKPIDYKAVGRNCGDPHCWNCQSFLLFGCLPEVKNLPFYADLRNRVCADGTEWLQPEMKEAMTSRLWEQNRKNHRLIDKFKKILLLRKF